MIKVTHIAFVFLLMLGISCKPMEQDICIDPAKVNPDVMCTMQYDPVCGCDNKTYGNACVANNAGVTSFTKGTCAEVN